MGKKRLKRDEWITVILGVVLFVPTALFVGFFIYSRLHPDPEKPGLQTVETGPPVFETSEDGSRDRVDAAIVLESMDTSMGGFSHWRGARTVVFYFSAACPHCKKAFPVVQALADSLATEGIQTIALAIKENSHDGIFEFTREQHSHLPMYHDEERRFGERYGYRTVPLIVLVDSAGEYIKIPGFKASTPGRIRLGLEMMLASHHSSDSVGG